MGDSCQFLRCPQGIFPIVIVQVLVWFFFFFLMVLPFSILPSSAHTL
jgi:hypothetical protein